MSGTTCRPGLKPRGIYPPVTTGRGLFSLSLLLLCLLTACNQGDNTAANVAVSIESEDVEYSSFESYMRHNIDSTALPLEPKVMGQLFDQFVDEHLLTRLAGERGMETPEEAPVDQRRALEFLLRNVELETDVDAEVRRFYESRQEDYQRPESVQLEQILVYERGEAVRARQAVVAGEDFSEVAARFSQVPVAQGEQGRLAHGDLPESFADAIFALGEGEVSEIFAADYGFHIFRVVERFPAEQTPLEAVSDEIRRTVERRLLDEAVAGFINEARERYNVEIHLSNFPFDYQGRYR